MNSKLRKSVTEFSPNFVYSVAPKQAIITNRH